MQRLPLTSIGAVASLDTPTDPDDPGAGGGFDHVSYFRNRYIPKLADCTAEVEAVYLDWVGQHGLSTALREQTPGNVLVHATSSSLQGLFEMTYRVDLDTGRARVTVYFYSADGARHTPSGIDDMLTQWGIAMLQDALDHALACGTG